MIALQCNTRQQQLGAAEHGEAYRRFVVDAGTLYLSVRPNPNRDDLWAGEYGTVIFTQLAAYRITDDLRFLDRACALADESIRVFWEDGQPLPRASTRSDYYDVVTGSDTLILSLLALHEQLTNADPQIEISDLMR